MMLLKMPASFMLPQQVVSDAIFAGDGLGSQPIPNPGEDLSCSFLTGVSSTAFGEGPYHTHSESPDL